MELESFQLEIREAREFLCMDSEARKRRPKVKSLNVKSLKEMLEWFSDKCTIVITLGHMGAVARRKGSDSVVLAWPYDLRRADIKDTTGAGDAFGAGFVSTALKKKGLKTDKDLKEAAEVGRLWGAYACTTLGGANDCPGEVDLDKFAGHHSKFRESEVKTMEEAEPILKILDRVFEFE